MFLDGRQPVKYGLKLEIDEKYRLLKEELAKLCGLPSSRILLVEMYASNIRVSGSGLEWGVSCMHLTCRVTGMRCGLPYESGTRRLRGMVYAMHGVEWC